MTGTKQRLVSTKADQTTFTVWMKQSLNFIKVFLKATKLSIIAKLIIFFCYIYAKGEGLIKEEVANSTWWLLEMQRKGT